MNSFVHVKLPQFCRIATCDCIFFFTLMEVNIEGSKSNILWTLLASNSDYLELFGGKWMGAAMYHCQMKVQNGYTSLPIDLVCGLPHIGAVTQAFRMWNIVTIEDYSTRFWCALVALCALVMPYGLPAPHSTHLETMLGLVFHRHCRPTPKRAIGHFGMVRIRALLV